MIVTEQHYVTPLTLVAVPWGILGRIKPGVFPNPGTLDDFSGGPAGDLRTFDGCFAELVGGLFNTPRIAGPLRAIGVAVFHKAVFGAVIRGSPRSEGQCQLCGQRRICSKGDSSCRCKFQNKAPTKA